MVIEEYYKGDKDGRSEGAVVVMKVRVVIKGSNRNSKADSRGRGN